MRISRRRRAAALACVNGVVQCVTSHNPAPSSLAVGNTLNLPRLQVALRSQYPHRTFQQVHIVGTRTDGTAGWDELPPDTTDAPWPQHIRTITEAEALHRHLGRSNSDQTGYVILAENQQGAGSVRLWMARPHTAQLEPVTVDFGGHNFGHLYTLLDGTIVHNPALLAAIINQLLDRYRATKRLYIWSQQIGLSGGSYAANGSFWWWLDATTEQTQIKLLTNTVEPLNAATRISLS